MESKMMTCRDCGEEFQSFLVRGFWMSRCPTCLDKAQHRPTVVVERVALSEPLLCVVESLPGGLQQARADGKRDVPFWKLVVKGSDFGARWNGRIDIFSRENIVSGDVVLLTEMKSVHRRDGDGGEVIERRKYVRLDKADASEVDVAALPRLVWRVANTKTTLKGYGRQYCNKLDGSPLWERRVSGGVRSGRMYTVAALAVVDDDHPLSVLNVFDY